MYMNLRKGLTDLFLSERRGRAVELTISSVSQLYHYALFEVKKPKTTLEKGMLIVSVDVDVGSKKLAQINRGRNDANVHRYLSEHYIGEIEERALPMFIDMFDTFEIPATFAMRGQLTETDDSILELLLKSPVTHDVGAHGYYHRKFQSLSMLEAQSELSMISTGMKKFGITPKSFVFPGNSVSHLRLLEKFGYECFRDYGDFQSDTMSIEKNGRLYNVRPSLYVNQSVSAFLLERILDIAIAKKAPLHLWFHPWNLGQTNQVIQKNINEVFTPFLRYAKKKERNGVLTFETMFSAAKKADEISRCY